MENDSNFITKLAKKWLEDNKVDQKALISPIENLWALLKKQT